MFLSLPNNRKNPKYKNLIKWKKKNYMPFNGWSKRRR